MMSFTNVTEHILCWRQNFLNAHMSVKLVLEGFYLICV